MKTGEVFDGSQDIDLETIDKITAFYSNEPGNLLPILRDVQKETKYLSDNILIRIADNLDIPLSQVYGVATFYSLFTVKPKGKYIVRVCEDAPCHVLDLSLIHISCPRAPRPTSQLLPRLAKWWILDSLL